MREAWLTLAGGARRETLVLLVLLAFLPNADGFHPGRSGGGRSAARPSTRSVDGTSAAKELLTRGMVACAPADPLRGYVHISADGLSSRRGARGSSTHMRLVRSLSLRGGASIEDDDEVERAVEDDLSLQSSGASGCDPKSETRDPRT